MEESERELKEGTSKGREEKRKGGMLREEKVKGGGGEKGEKGAEEEGENR